MLNGIRHGHGRHAKNRRFHLSEFAEQSVVRSDETPCIQLRQSEIDAIVRWMIELDRDLRGQFQEMTL